MGDQIGHEPHSNVGECLDLQEKNIAGICQAMSEVFAALKLVEVERPRRDR